MTLSRPAVFVALLALSCAALVTRHASTHRTDSPYFKGSAAMDYRSAMAVADGASLRTHDPKAAHPEGFVPARARASGVEYAAGYAFRVARFFGENDGRVFTRRLTALCAALCVISAYTLARGLWNCRAAGLLAAFLVASLAPLVGATNGRVFSHTIFAALLASVHASLALRAIAGRSVAQSLAAAAVAFALCAVWEPAPLILVAWIVPVALSRSGTRALRSTFAISHVGALVAAGAVLPHLAAARGPADWTTAAAVVGAAVAAAPDRLRVAWRPAALWVAGSAALTALATPLRAGALEQLPATDYVLTRLRFLFGRPEDASALSDWMRSLWSLQHAPLAVEPAIQLFLPLLVLASATLSCRACRQRRSRLIASAAAAMVGAAAVLIDRSALPIAAMALIPFASGGACALPSGPKVRPLLVAVGVLAAIASTTARGSIADPAYQVVRAVGAARPHPDAFVWVSLENTDRELIRFVAARTSVRESFLAPEEVSALLLAFSGRTIVQLPGAASRAPSERHVALTRAMYGSEMDLYHLCRKQQIDYVLYSIDFLLDTGRYSPRYLAGVAAIDPSSAAFRMHFDPESLRHFMLLYENDHYRLFQVSDAVQPVFLTDHPLFYQAPLFDQAGRDLDEFRERMVHLMLACAEAINAGTAGDEARARARLAWCVQQAPRFTRARMALADVLMNMGRYEEAREQVAAVFAYAPDNPLALYYAAYLEVQLERPDAAKPYLTLLFAQKPEPTLLRKAQALQSAIEHKLPLKPPPPQRG